MKPGSNGRLKEKSPQGVLLLGAFIGLGSFVYYYLHGLTTVHFDAKAHLLVARRIIDTALPGYSQMGAHWLPLIHLLYLPFVAFESQYRSGLIPSLISVGSFAVSGWLVFRIALQLTASRIAGYFAAAVLLANPNLQFLQSAPLTEPVYMVLSLAAMDSMLRWRENGASRVPWLPATWASLAALCRYEGWLLVGGMIALIGYDFWNRQISRPHALKAAAAYLGLFAAPVFAHFGYIYLRLGDSFFQRVARGSPAPYETHARPLLSIVYHAGELAQMAAIVPLLIALAGVVYSLCARDRLQRCLPYFLLWLPSLANVAALYWGLMYRVRYSSLLLPAVAVFGSLILSRAAASRRVTILVCLAIFSLPWLSWVFPRVWEYHFMRPGPGILLLPAASLVVLLAACALGRYPWALVTLAVLGMQIPALEGESRAMLSESREHAYIEPEQQEVLQYLRLHYEGSLVLIDVGRLAPLMYDSALPIREFVCHEGDPTNWLKAVEAPRRHVGWLLAEKGDEVWGLLQIDPRWADGYSLAVQTENYVLYQRNPEGRDRVLPAGRLK